MRHAHSPELKSAASVWYLRNFLLAFNHNIYMTNILFMQVICVSSYRDSTCVIESFADNRFCCFLHFVEQANYKSACIKTFLDIMVRHKYSQTVKPAIDANVFVAAIKEVTIAKKSLRSYQLYCRSQYMPF
ncbi:uncharacterized protein LOC129237963 [Anastrepha obliqua]|uniref:uncharacterized protein LOC129237963 n=1 Tax=Anastrepha obliqua TaxID=95512 RepID=UPI002409B802|nr:uncharacterized protein LOC129237963 [Anastrepha obliqua]